ncbi:hypothetical protein A3C23_00755 [Candidatus Roizmanbacteria bacterium RIFCSPHIGHO2_02_FULL_37_13b]|uniref:Glycosyltransferase 2-like domain-containing protein n=1 Tax=Candidatus Roizmanbacteria bacterium RIFCSPLOWO2_02_FULL_36_11 TaxID=1802071 RepID=A0A1F7JD51_9BACT|nr:MAG: hypothetical protein A3C23_00755 [Candidatus Roizmanbacteria bacterium RIFCSPHIGHO2_02_FULL_37_13b]OGK53527.1 MAG: hypothetical protein A3H78_04865 [Candidatus Roizmanbacteria bacterium RIFCSPLOWO2_02_FULL_36_11]
MTKPEYSIIFPVLNQADHIEKVTLGYREILKHHNYSYELIAVVNDTVDNSFEILKKLTKKYPEIRTYELQGRGFGLGILYGLQKSNGKYLCYLNCARISAEQLFKSLEVFNKDKSLVIHNVRIDRENWSRSFGSMLYNSICKLIFQIPNHDINGNPKVFSRDVFKKLNLKFTDSMIDLEFLEKAKNSNIKIIEIPLDKYERHGGKSTTSVWTIFRLLKELSLYFIKTRFKSNHSL